MDAIHPTERRSFERRMRDDGEWEYRCRRCDKWLRTRMFRSHQHMRYGIDSTCRSCRSEYEQAHYKTRQKRDVKKRIRRTKLREHEGQAVWRGDKATPTRSRMKGRAEVTPRMRDAAATLLRSAETDEEWYTKETYGIERKTLVNLRDGVTEWVTLSMGERLSTLLLDPDLLDDWLPDWNRAGDKRCKACGTNVHPHQAKGLCRLCYHRDYYGHPVEGGRPEAMWSRYHHCCKGCGTTERKHGGRGLCTRCYYRDQHSRRPTVKDTWRRSCVVCGDRFDCSNPKQVYCSGACKRAGYEYNKTGRLVIPTRPATCCEECGGPLPPGSSRRRRFCTLTCKGRTTTRKQKEARKALREAKERAPAPT